MPKAKSRKTRCPYCKKAHRCHNKCAAKRVGRRITKAGKPRAAKRVSYAIARGCSPRRGRKSKAAKRSRASRATPTNRSANFAAGYRMATSRTRGEPIQIVGRGGKPGKVINFPTAEAAKAWARSKGVLDRMVFVRDT